MVKKLSNEEVFVENSYYARHHIKRRVIEQRLIPYECSECGNKGKHNNKTLSLQLDHVNGNGQDHRLENLRFLCPNCHSQTDTYAGKGSKGKRKYVKDKEIIHYEEKLKTDKALWEKLKKDETIKFGKWGWKTRLCEKIGIKSQKVTPWLKRVDPEFLKQFE
jgi:5-methylcytosine-specific restriction endonuclease McrA